MLVAVFRQQIREHLDATERARRTVVCIAIDPGGAAQSPSREFMARLAGEPARRSGALAKLDGAVAGGHSDHGAGAPVADGSADVLRVESPDDADLEV